MVGPHPLYCQVFVDSSLSEHELTLFVMELVKGRLRNFTIDADVLEIDVRRNDWIMSSPGEERSFLEFPYYLDIEPPTSASVAREDYIAAIGYLLRGFWAKGYDAVAACKFEEDLPRRMG